MTPAAALRQIAAGVLALADALESAPIRAVDELVDAHTSGIGVRLYRRLVREGVLPASRVGRRYLVRRSDVDAWLTAQRVVTTAATSPLVSAEATVESTVDELIARELIAGRLRSIRGGR